MVPWLNLTMPSHTHSIPYYPIFIAIFSVLVNPSFPEIHQVDSWIHAEKRLKIPRVSPNRPRDLELLQEPIGFTSLSLSPCFTPHKRMVFPWFCRCSQQVIKSGGQVSLASSNINFQPMTSAWISAAAKSCLSTRTKPALVLWCFATSKHDMVI